MALGFNIAETKHVIKKLTTHVTDISKLLINKPIKDYIAVSLSCSFPQMQFFRYMLNP